MTFIFTLLHAYNYVQLVISLRLVVTPYTVNCSRLSSHAHLNLSKHFPTFSALLKLVVAPKYNFILTKFLGTNSPFFFLSGKIVSTYSTSLFSKHRGSFSLCFPFLIPFHFQAPAINHAISFLVIGQILSCSIPTSYLGTRKRKKSILTFFRICLVFLFHYISIPLVILYNLLSSGACRLYKYRVIHKFLRDFRTRLRNNQDRHGRKEHFNR